MSQDSVVIFRIGKQNKTQIWKLQKPSDNTAIKKINCLHAEFSSDERKEMNWDERNWTELNDNEIN